MSILAGKTAIVTGGGHGVGRGIALALAREGARIVVCGRTANTLAKVRREIEERGGSALDVVCDITIAADRQNLIASTLERFGGINILINNAALIPHGTLLEIDDDLVQNSWNAGPFAALKLMQLCHPHMKGDGAIVNVSSGAAMAPKVPVRGIYAAIKAALNAISRAAANEWGPDGIRVNTIMPFALTEALEQTLEREPDHMNAFISQLPLGRIGDPEEDIGRAVVFLVGPDSRYLTGATLSLDGGGSYIR